MFLCSTSELFFYFVNRQYYSQAQKATTVAPAGAGRPQRVHIVSLLVSLDDNQLPFFV